MGASTGGSGKGSGMGNASAPKLPMQRQMNPMAGLGQQATPQPQLSSVPMPDLHQVLNKPDHPMNPISSIGDQLTNLTKQGEGVIKSIFSGQWKHNIMGENKRTQSLMGHSIANPYLGADATDVPNATNLNAINAKQISAGQPPMGISDYGQQPVNNNAPSNMGEAGTENLVNNSPLAVTAEHNPAAENAKLLSYIQSAPQFNPLSKEGYHSFVQPIDNNTTPSNGENSTPIPNTAAPTAGTNNFMSLSPDKATRLQQIKEAAENTYGQSTPMAKLAMSQAVLESRLLGNPSSLAQKYNNLFGIKGKGTAGSALMPTTEYTASGSPYKIKDKFASNTTLEDSFQQHKKLMSISRYKNVGQAKTFQEAAQAVRKAGYATDPKYPQLLMSVYRQAYGEY